MYSNSLPHAEDSALLAVTSGFSIIRTVWYELCHPQLYRSRDVPRHQVVLVIWGIDACGRAISMSAL